MGERGALGTGGAKAAGPAKANEGLLTAMAKLGLGADQVFGGEMGTAATLVETLAGLDDDGVLRRVRALEAPNSPAAHELYAHALGRLAGGAASKIAFLRAVGEVTLSVPVPLVTRALADPDPEIGAAAIATFGRRDAPGILDTVLGKLGDTSVDSRIRTECVRALAGRPEPEASETLRGLMADPNPHVKREALAAADQRNEPFLAGMIRAGAGDGNYYVRAMALSLANKGKGNLGDALVALGGDFRQGPPAANAQRNSMHKKVYEKAVRLAMEGLAGDTQGAFAPEAVALAIGHDFKGEDAFGRAVLTYVAAHMGEAEAEAVLRRGLVQSTIRDGSLEGELARFAAERFPQVRERLLAPASPNGAAPAATGGAPPLSVKGAVAALEAAFREGSPARKRECLTALDGVDPRQWAKLLRDALGDADVQVRSAAFGILVRRNDPRDLGHLLDGVRSGSPWLRTDVAKRIAQEGAHAHADALREYLGNYEENSQSLKAVVRLLKRWDGEGELGTVLHEAIARPHAKLRIVLEELNLRKPAKR